MLKPTAPIGPAPTLALGAAMRSAGRQPILGLDPGWRTGWALSDGQSGTIDVNRWREDEAQALIEFTAAIEKLLPRCRGVVIERPMGRMVATEWPATLTRLVHMAALQRKLPRREITSTDVRKGLTGRAFNVPDPEVIDAVKRLGYRPNNEHEADAAAALAVWIATHQGDPI